MIETILQVATPIIAVLSGAIASYVVVKRTLTDELIVDKLDMVLTEFTQNTEMQKKIYLIGAILGQGVKSGIGFAGKGGKFKMDDILGMAIGQIFGKITGNPQASSTPTEQPVIGDPFNVS